MHILPLGLTVVLFATPPEEMTIQPPVLTVVRFAVPPEEMYISLPELTVVLFATPPEEMYIWPPDNVVLFATVFWCAVILPLNVNPSIVLETNVTFAPSST